MTLTLTQAKLLEASGTTSKRKTIHAMAAAELVTITGHQVARKKSGGYKLCYDYTVTEHGKEALQEANKRSKR